MATKSILKSVVFRDKRNASRFIKAVEKAKTVKSKPVSFSKTVNFVQPEQIDRLFSHTE